MSFIDNDRALGVVTRCGSDSMLLPGDRCSAVQRGTVQLLCCCAVCCCVGLQPRAASCGTCIHTSWRAAWCTREETAASCLSPEPPPHPPPSPTRNPQFPTLLVGRCAWDVRFTSSVRVTPLGSTCTHCTPPPPPACGAHASVHLAPAGQPFPGQQQQQSHHQCCRQAPPGGPTHPPGPPSPPSPPVPPTHLPHPPARPPAPCAAHPPPAGTTRSCGWATGARSTWITTSARRPQRTFARGPST